MAQKNICATFGQIFDWGIAVAGMLLFEWNYFAVQFLGLECWRRGPENEQSTWGRPHGEWVYACSGLGRLGISTSHSVVGRPAVCRNGVERPAQTRPAVPRWAGGPHLYTHYHLPEECHPKSDGEKLQFGEECRRRPNKCRVGYENRAVEIQMTDFIYCRLVTVLEAKHERCPSAPHFFSREKKNKIVRDLFFAPPPTMTQQNRRTQRIQRKQMKRAKRDQCNLDVMYF